MMPKNRYFLGFGATGFGAGINGLEVAISDPRTCLIPVVDVETARIKFGVVFFGGAI